MKDKIRTQKGFAASDALIAILIIALFAGLIANISYNIYLANSSIKRMSKATGYIVDMFEYIDKNYYDDVTESNLIKYFNNKYYYEDDGNIPKENSEVKIKEEATEVLAVPFETSISIIKYNEQEGNEGKIDLVKEITMKVTYKLGNKNQTIEMKKIKQRENLEIPNKPDLTAIQLEEGEIIYPIKNTQNGWIVCDSRDNGWYNYENGIWAVILKTNRELVINQKVDNLEENDELNFWIPRYAYDNTNNKVIALFKNTNKTINKQEGDKYSKLKGIDEIEGEYDIPQEFTLEGEAIQGKWIKNIEDELAMNLKKIYPANNLK